MSSGDTVKRIAELVRAGAVLSSYVCPACSTVLVKLKSGEYYCARCEKTVLLAKSEEEAKVVSEVYQIKEARSAVFNRILELSSKIETAPLEHLPEYTRTLIMLLDAYEKLMRIGTKEEK